MAIRAVAKILEHTVNTTDNTKIDLIIQISVLGGQLGTLPSSTYHIYPTGFALGNVTQFNAAVEDAIKADLTAKNVPLVPADTVVML